MVSIGKTYGLLEKMCIKYNANKYEAFTKLQDEEHGIHFMTGTPYTIRYYYMALSRIANYYRIEYEKTKKV